MLHIPQFKGMRKDRQRRERMRDRAQVLARYGIDWSSAWAISSFLEKKCDEVKRNGSETA